MSVQVVYSAARMPTWRPGAKETSAPQRLSPGGTAAVAIDPDDPAGVVMATSGDEARRLHAAFLLIDLGMRRALLYALADAPLYRDGEEILCAVLAPTSPRQRWVIRVAGVAGGFVITPASAVRQPAGTGGTCAYCSGSFAAGDPVVVCGCSGQAVVHGADEGLDCWKRSSCTSCGWPLDTAAEAANAVDAEVVHGTA